MGTVFYPPLRETVRDSVKFLLLYLFLLKNATFHFGTSKLELKHQPLLMAYSNQARFHMNVL